MTCVIETHDVGESLDGIPTLGYVKPLNHTIVKKITFELMESDSYKAEKEFAGQITDHLNTFLHDHELFCAAMSTEHRTLQQNFTRLCFAWLEFCASDDYRYDGRNEGSHQISKTIIEAYKAKVKADWNVDEIGSLPNWLGHV